MSNNTEAQYSYTGTEWRLRPRTAEPATEADAPVSSHANAATWADSISLEGFTEANTKSSTSALVTGCEREIVDSR